MTLNNIDFTFLANMIKKHTGIYLPEDKAYLVESRLLPVCHSIGLSDLHEFCDYIKTHTNDSKLITQIIEAMTTNESSFFRDASPFEHFKKTVVPHILKHKSDKQIDIWSAACSTGQEPYSIALCFKETAALKDIACSILATDIDTTAMAKAKSGIYTQFEVQRGLPITTLMKHFTQVEQNWHIKDDIKSMLETQQCNLLEGLNSSKKFDIIFCRNVLIYFDKETKRKVFENLHKQLAPHGVLFLGNSESILGNGEDLFTSFEGLSGIYTVK